EGEAVERERHLAAWPGDDSVVAADALVLSADAPIVEGLSLRIAPGEALVAVGSDSRVRRAVALAVAGRLTPDDGKLRVVGHLLPGRAAWVRGHVGYVPVDDADAALIDLKEALRGKSSLVIIDGVDRFSGGQRDQATAMLQDAAASRPLAVFATASDPALAQAILSESAWPYADLIDVSTTPATIEATEVNA